VQEIAGRARAGEPRAQRVFRELGDAIAEFLVPSLRAFEPTCLVVGGSIARSFDLLEARLRTGLEVVECLRTVTAAERLDDAALLGAARFAAAVRA
jgi:glucokinase